MTVTSHGQISTPLSTKQDDLHISVAQKPIDAKSRYHVLESIGRGSFGEARHHESQLHESLQACIFQSARPRA